MSVNTPSDLPGSWYVKVSSPIVTVAGIVSTPLRSFGLSLGTFITLWFANHFCAICTLPKSELATATWKSCAEPARLWSLCWKSRCARPTNPGYEASPLPRRPRTGELPSLAASHPVALDPKADSTSDSVSRPDVCATQWTGVRTLGVNTAPQAVSRRHPAKSEMTLIFLFSGGHAPESRDDLTCVRAPVSSSRRSRPPAPPCA